MHESTEPAPTIQPEADGPPALRFPFDATSLVESPLRTPRLVLRPLEASDAADVYEYQRLPEVLVYLPWPERAQVEAYAHTATRAAARVLAADGDFFVLAMSLPGAPSLGGAGHDRVIGDMMVRVSSVKHAQLELGWVVHPDFQGKGYAREAALAIRDFAFETLNPHRMQAFLDARNAASAALCERLGMRREATILEEQFNDGEWQDTALYGVLQREWSASRARDVESAAAGLTA
ncbi:GNAT family N-acetyltransferase [Agromyces subbeticus]|uniref:GNAT family N-acetyltransferase n=1 Tax=Agromyces subbeticus TaxID=293890 RepID=UPI0003B76FAC|nr:GNAT family protein [Agromyces subbeticus]